jgi:hypothetical protein
VARALTDVRFLVNEDCSCDLVEAVVAVQRSARLIGVEQVMKRPKTAAGLPTVALPSTQDGNSEYARPLAGRMDLRQAIRQAAGSTELLGYLAAAITAAALPGMHFHDLRQIGNHLAAMSGASPRDLMGRWAT